jgi:rare lipoprotein A
MTALHRSLHALAALGLAAVLAACGTAPKGGRDGPEANPPPNLSSVPDATPQVESIRSGGPNKPYEVLGKDYTPLKDDKPLSEKGLASWYGKKFHGRRTASGEVYNMYAMTAAHKTMPLPSYARVRNPANGREIIVRINDRGPFHPGRVIDLSYTAALKLGVLNGVAPVEVERITYEDIRSGAWRRGGEAGDTAVAAKGVAVPTEVVVPVVEVRAPLQLPPEKPAADNKAVADPPAAPLVAPIVESPSAEPSRAFTQAAQGYWVQLGAFKQREGAEQFQRRVGDELAWLSPLLAVFGETSMFRLQAGPYPTRDEAQEAAGKVRSALKLVPVIVERR